MSNQLKWFVAEAIFQATVHTKEADLTPVHEVLLFLVGAADHPSALTKAQTIARAKEHSYQNEAGQLVTWTFVRIAELTEMIDQQFEDGAELKSAMIESDRKAIGDEPS